MSSVRITAYVPIIVYACALMLLDAIYFAVQPTSMVGLINGFMIAQFLLLSLMGGCFGRSWLHGYVLICSILFAFIILTGLIRHADMQVVFLTLDDCYAAPFNALALALPFLIARFAWGWSLTMDISQQIPRPKLRIEDLLEAFVLVASFLTLYASSQFIHHVEDDVSEDWANTQSYWTRLIAGSFIAGLVMYPLTWIFFRLNNFRDRTSGYLVFAITLSIFGFIPIIALAPVQPKDFKQFLLAILAAVVTLGLGFWTMWYSGVKLTRYASNGDHNAEQLEFTPESILNRKHRLQRRFLLGLTFLFAVTSSFSAMLYRQMRSDRERQTRLLTRKLEDRGGQLLRMQKTVDSIRVGQDFSDFDFPEIATFGSIQHLSFADSQISDLAIGKLSSFPRLQRVDLSGTKVTLEGLKRIPASIRSIALGRTNITIAELVEFLRSRSFTNLDIRGLGITDAQVIELADSGSLKSVQGLNLADNPISDSSIQRLLSGRTLSALDVSNTNIDGSGILPGSVTGQLVLNRTRIDDQILSTLIRPGLRISVQSTSISGHFLKTQASWNGELILGNSRITEDDLLNAGTKIFQGLGLHDKSYTGKCFENGNISTKLLDMSHSGLSDKDVHFLSNVVGLATVVLSDTEITDAALPVLATLSANLLFLTKTQVTCEGLLKARMIDKHIFISSSDFSEAELARLLALPNIHIDQRLF